MNKIFNLLNKTQFYSFLIRSLGRIDLIFWKMFRITHLLCISMVLINPSGAGDGGDMARPIADSCVKPEPENGKIYTLLACKIDRTSFPTSKFKS